MSLLLGVTAALVLLPSSASASAEPFGRRRRMERRQQHRAMQEEEEQQNAPPVEGGPLPSTIEETLEAVATSGTPIALDGTTKQAVDNAVGALDSAVSSAATTPPTEAPGAAAGTSGTKDPGFFFNSGPSTATSTTGAKPSGFSTIASAAASATAASGAQAAPIQVVEQGVTTTMTQAVAAAANANKALSVEDAYGQVGVFGGLWAGQAAALLRRVNGPTDRLTDEMIRDVPPSIRISIHLHSAWAHGLVRRPWPP
jgi:hypothetical protein